MMKELANCGNLENVELKNHGEMEEWDALLELVFGRDRDRNIFTKTFAFST